MKTPGENPTPKIADPDTVNVVRQNLNRQNALLQEMRNTTSSQEFMGRWEQIGTHSPEMSNALDSVSDQEFQEYVEDMRSRHYPSLEFFMDLADKNFELQFKDDNFITPEERAKAVDGYQAYLDEIATLI